MECLYCSREILKESKEHVIHNALGGHLVSTEICCPQCNNAIQKLIDDDFTNVFAPITTRINNLKKSSNTKNKPSATAFGLYNGEIYEVVVKGDKIVSCPQLSKKLKRPLSADDRDAIEIVSYKFDLDNRIFINGISKIATNFALMNKIPFQNLQDRVSIQLEGGTLKGIEFNYLIVPFTALNHFDWFLETATPIDALYHHLILFNVGKYLWCYVDLFNTFQYYILLNDSWNEENIYIPYCQKIEKIDRTTPTIRVRKPKDILTYSQIYQVKPTYDLDDLKKSIEDKIIKAPYECDINDLIKVNMNVLEPILDFSEDKQKLSEYLNAVIFYQNEDGNLHSGVFRRFSPNFMPGNSTYASYPDLIYLLLKDDPDYIRKYTFGKLERLNQYLSS